MGRTVISRKDFELITSQQKQELERLRRQIEKIRLQLQKGSTDGIPSTNQEHKMYDELSELERLVSFYEISENRQYRKIDKYRESSGVAGAAKGVEAETERTEELSNALPKADTYINRLVKYIPSEVVALYLTLDSIIRSSTEIPKTVYWSVFVFGIVATYLYLRRVLKVTKRLQLTISVGAFCVWVFALGGPFVHLSWYNPVFAGIILPIYTFLIAIVEA